MNYGVLNDHYATVGRARSLAVSFGVDIELIDRAVYFNQLRFLRTTMNAFKQLTIGALYVGTLGVALAAQPPAMPSRVSVAPGLGMATASVTPGKLNAMKADAQVVANTPFTLKFEGSGHCTLEVNGGDGYTKSFEGDLPFDAPYTYSTASMLSFESSKNYTAKAKPTGNCKLTGSISAVTLEVTVTNPNPQGVGGPANNSTVSSTLKVGAKLGLAAIPPTVPAALISIVALAQPVAAGAPTLLIVSGTGNCKYDLSYVNLDAQGNTILKPYPMLPQSSSAQSSFPMTIKGIASTPAGVYKWTAAGRDGCAGNVNVTITAQ